MIDELLVALLRELTTGFGEIKNLEPIYMVIAVVMFVNWVIYMMGLFTIVRWIDHLLPRRKKRSAHPIITQIRPVKSQEIK